MLGGLKLFFSRTYGIDHIRKLVEYEYFGKPKEEKEEKVHMIMEKIVERALHTAGYIILR